MHDIQNRRHTSFNIVCTPSMRGLRCNQIGENVRNHTFVNRVSCAMLKHDPTLELKNCTSIVSTAIYGRLWFQTSIGVTTDLMSVYGRQIFSQGLSVNIPGQDLSIFSNTIKVKTALVLCKFYEVKETTGSSQDYLGCQQGKIAVTMYFKLLCDRHFSNLVNSDPFWGISLVSELLWVWWNAPVSV